jgi:hypothetical protein
MKKVLVIAAALFCAYGAFAQGTVNFNNRVTSGTGAQGIIQAPVYSPDPANPALRKSGQSAAGNPAGSTVYGGSGLVGTGFTVQLWGIGASSYAGNDSVLLLGTGTSSQSFRTATSGAGYTAAGFAVGIQNAPAGAGSRAALQLRVWDNQGGTITDWASAQTAWQQGRIALGKSDVFIPDFDLGGGGTQPPNLIGLQSFNVTIVPEPSTIALALAGGFGLLFLRRRNK